MSVNPPGGVNLTVAIFALVGAAISIVGFIAHYSPRHQYGDLCSILQDLNNIFADYECQEGNNNSQWLLLLPSELRSRLYQQFCRHVMHCFAPSRVVSADVHLTQYFWRSRISSIFVLNTILRACVWCPDSSEIEKTQKECFPIENWAHREPSRHTSCELDNWCYESFYLGSLSNRERQKDTEDHGDVTISNFKQDHSSNGNEWFKLRTPTGVISKEVWSFLISLFDGP